jgi:hypothetical protein
MSSCDCSDASINTISPIEFSGSLLKFRFIDIDVNVTISLESGDFLFIPGFRNTDSVAHINIPRDLLNSLFYFNITYTDLSNSVWTNMKYAMNRAYWPDISFCNSIVNKNKAINPNARYQQLQLDLTRYIIASVTGSIYYNGIFRNKDTFIEKIVLADTGFNNQIKSIIDLCGTTTTPMTNESYYNNPCRVLIESILAQDNVLETDNIERKETLINYMKDTVSVDFSNNTTTKFYIKTRLTQNDAIRIIYTLAIKPGVFNGITYDTLYPIYSLVDANGKEYTNITEPLYRSSSEPLNSFLYNINTTIPSNHTDYLTFYNKFWPFKFIYGDSLSVRLTYKPLNNTFLGKEIKDRSYEVYLDVGLETITDILYKSSGDEGYPAIVESGTPRVYKANGINTAFQYLLFNTTTNDPYVSPYNFYPTLFDISNIEFSTRVLKRYPISSNVFQQNPGPDDIIIINNEVFDFSDWYDLMEPNNNLGYMYLNTNFNVITNEAQTLYDLSFNKSSVNWHLSIFTRPRNKGLTTDLGVGFDRFDSIPYVTAFDLWNTGVWNNFNLTNMMWKNDLNVSLTWQQLTMTQINSVTPYGTAEFNGDQQIMAIAIVTSYADFNGYIKNVKLTFNDGRYIQMV